MRKISIIVTTCVVVVLGSLAWRAFQSRPQQSSNSLPDKVAQAEQTKQFFSINGAVIDEIVAQMRPIAVMIENHPDARPQSGLDKADIVYETLAEGGITRFLALYQTSLEATIGPVRSARDYYAELASEYGAVFAHVGGSDEALAGLAAKRYAGVDDANQYFLDNYFTRTKNRAAPHNVYTSMQKLRNLIVDKKWNNTLITPLWKFSDTPAAGSEPATQVTINFSLPSYGTRYEYDAGSGLYKRFMAGLPHTDVETKSQILVKTLVVQLVDIEATPNDPKLRVDIDLSSGGHAYVFANGTVTHVTWKKDGNRTRYYDVSGKEIEFARGKIWVALAPHDSTSVTWK